MMLVSLEKLQELAAMLPQEPPKPVSSYHGSGESFDLERWISDQGVEVRYQAPWGSGRKWVLERCVWNPEHDDKSAYIVQHQGGAIAAGCHHNSCQGQGWPELREVFEPGYWDRRQSFGGAYSPARPSTNGHYPNESGDDGDESARRVVQVNNRFLRDIAGDAVAALVESNIPPYLFLRGSELVRLAETSFAADAISIPSLKGVLDRCADFVKAKKGDLDEDVLIPARPPDDVVKDLLSQRQLPFPMLKGFASTPVFLPGGRLLACDGYDAESGTYLNLAGLRGLKWDMPLVEAKTLVLDELLVDFPFADESSKAMPSQQSSNHLYA